jgi:hypothetical protein
MFARLWPYCTLRDRWDDLRAIRRRADLARRRWLVSWHRRGDGSWLARVSSPDLPVTIERASSTRCRAIDRAARYLADLADVDPRGLRPGP